MSEIENKVDVAKDIEGLYDKTGKTIDSLISVLDKLSDFERRLHDIEKQMLQERKEKELIKLSM